MATPVKMPQMGESVVEGTIIKWLKGEGDAVEMDEPLVEVSTDKVDTEIPSPVAGTIVKHLVEEGDTVEVGTDLCEVDESGDGGTDESGEEEAPAEAEEAPAEEEQEPEPESEEEPEPEPEPEPESEEEPEPERAAEEEEGDGERPAASRAPSRAPERGGPPTRDREQTRPGQVLSPLVRRLAREHDVDLSRIEGTGSGGRITKQDVLDSVDGEAPAREAPAEEAPRRQAPPAVRPQAGDRDEVKPLSHIRKRIAEHMLGSLETSARAWNAVEVDMEGIALLRQKVNPEFKRREGFSLTYMPFITRAVVDALQQHPVVNASIREDLSEAIYHNYVNIGVAVATDYGLIVPVVKGADGMNVVGLARAIRELAERARSKDLAPDDVGGSTFSITNPGPFGSVLSVPVINQPNVAILGTEAVEKRVCVVEGDAIAVRHRMFLSMTWDHRLLDGADAMQFLATLKENLETWDFSNEVGAGAE